MPAYIDQNGYLRNAETNELIHRSIAREKYGYLSPEDQVHHIDRNKLNNDPDNLMILSKTEHEIIHGKNELVNISNKIEYALGSAIIKSIEYIWKKLHSSRASKSS